MWLCVSECVCIYASLSVCWRLGFGGGGRQGMTKVKAVMCHFRCWGAGTCLQGCPLCQTHSDICAELSRCLFFFCSLHPSLPCLYLIHVHIHSCIFMQWHMQQLHDLRWHTVTMFQHFSVSFEWQRYCKTEHQTVNSCFRYISFTDSSHVFK